jgi:hypothetical protein
MKGSLQYHLLPVQVQGCQHIQGRRRGVLLLLVLQRIKIWLEASRVMTTLFNKTILACIQRYPAP